MDQFFTNLQDWLFKQDAAFVTLFVCAGIGYLDHKKFLEKQFDRMESGYNKVSEILEKCHDKQGG